MLVIEPNTWLSQILARTPLIKWLVRANALRLMASLAVRASKVYDVGSARRVLCLGRPIFNDEIDALSTYGGGINYIVMPKTVFIGIARCFLSGLAFEHVAYHARRNNDAEMSSYLAFLAKFFDELKSILGHQAIVSSNYVYSWQQEIAAHCLKQGMPFVVLHKEGITGRNDYDGLVRTYSNGKFVGTRLLVYNRRMRDALLAHNIEGLNSENIRVVGVPRFDRYFNIGQPGSKVVFFSFYIRDKIRHVGVSGGETPTWVAAADKFHLEVMRFAKQNPDIDVVIKTKKSPRYIDYVKKLVRFGGFDSLANLTITNAVSPFDLIKEASTIIGYNSCVLLEALIANRRVLSPYLGANCEPFFHQGTAAVAEVHSAEDIEREVRSAAIPLGSFDKKNLEDFIHLTDGNACKLAEAEIIDCLSS